MILLRVCLSGKVVFWNSPNGALHTPPLRAKPSGQRPGREHKIKISPERRDIVLFICHALKGFMYGC